MHDPIATAQFDRSGNHLTIYLSGELDHESSPRLTETIVRHILPGTEVVWIDLTAVSFCGSAGIALLLAVNRHAVAQGARLTLYEPAPSVLGVMEMCGLGQAVPIRSRSKQRRTRTTV